MFRLSDNSIIETWKINLINSIIIFDGFLIKNKFECFRSLKSISIGFSPSTHIHIGTAHTKTRSRQSKSNDLTLILFLHFHKASTMISISGACKSNWSNCIRSSVNTWTLCFVLPTLKSICEYFIEAIDYVVKIFFNFLFFIFLYLKSHFMFVNRNACT